MKKYILIFSLTGILMTSMILPHKETMVEVINPEKMNFTETVTVTGILEEQKKRDIAVDFPIVPKEVMVEVGEKVNIGDILATVDINATKDAVLTLASNYSDIIPKDITDLVKNLDLDSLLSSGLFPTEVVSTASGVVTSMTMTSGNMTLPKTTAAVVSSTDKLRARFFVSENDVEKITEGTEVLFTANALRDKVFSCTVTDVSPTAYQRLSGLNYNTVIDVVANIDKNYKGLRSGYTVKGKIPVSEEREVMVLPFETVFREETGEEYVFVYDAGKAVKRYVTTGEEFTTSVEITSGIKEDDMIILTETKLKSLQKVMVK